MHTAALYAQMQRWHAMTADYVKFQVYYRSEAKRSVQCNTVFYSFEQFMRVFYGRKGASRFLRRKRPFQLGTG
jgi:hypothetical protein